MPQNSIGLIEYIPSYSQLKKTPKISRFPIPKVRGLSKKRAIGGTVLDGTARGNFRGLSLRTVNNRLGGGGHSYHSLPPVRWLNLGHRIPEREAAACEPVEVRV